MSERLGDRVTAGWSFPTRLGNPEIGSRRVHDMTHGVGVTRGAPLRSARVKRAAGRQGDGRVVVPHTFPRNPKSGPGVAVRRNPCCNSIHAPVARLAENPYDERGVHELTQGYLSTHTLVDSHSRPPPRRPSASERRQTRSRPRRSARRRCVTRRSTRRRRRGRHASACRDVHTRRAHRTGVCPMHVHERQCARVNRKT